MLSRYVLFFFGWSGVGAEVIKKNKFFFYFIVSLTVRGPYEPASKIEDWFLYIIISLRALRYTLVQSSLNKKKNIFLKGLIKQLQRETQEYYVYDVHVVTCIPRKLKKNN